MRILLFNPGWGGGVARFYRGLYKSLLTSGHDVEPLSLRETVVPKLSNPAVNPTLLRLLKRLRRRYDIVHTVGLSASSFPYFMILSLRGFPPYVFTLHGSYQDELPHLGAWGHLCRLAMDLTLQCSDVVTVPCRFLLEKLPENVRGKTVVIPNGIDRKSILAVDEASRRIFGIPEDHLLLLTVTNFNYWDKCRGLDVLIPALLKLKLEDVSLLVAGGGRYEGFFLEKYGGLSRVRFLGYRRDLLSIMKMCDAYVHLSFLDVLPYSVLEALCMGKPVVTNPVGGLEEIITDNVNGLIAESREEVAECIVKLRDEDLRARLSEEAFNTAKNFEWRLVVRRFIKLYESLLKAG